MMEAKRYTIKTNFWDDNASIKAALFNTMLVVMTIRKHGKAKKRSREKRHKKKVKSI
jgi:hypothetical protein